MCLTFSFYVRNKSVKVLILNSTLSQIMKRKFVFYFSCRPFTAISVHYTMGCNTDWMCTDVNFITAVNPEQDKVVSKDGR